MVSDFLADECAHVELASRMAMELGGAAARTVDFDRFTTPPRGKTALQRANDIVLRLSCIAEAFSGGTAAVNLTSTSHPLARAVYETILRDEAHHRRLGGLYFEWAYAKLDDTELRRLGRILHGGVKALMPFWTSRAARSRAPAPWPEEHLQALGWLAPPKFADVAREVVVRDILDPLEALGIAVTREERAELLAGPGTG
jgi:hypothetical protein